MHACFSRPGRLSDVVEVVDGRGLWYWKTAHVVSDYFQYGTLYRRLEDAGGIEELAPRLSKPHPGMRKIA